MKKVKLGNFELLKIFSMLLIISFHYVYKGGINKLLVDEYSVNKIIADVFTMFGEIGVNLFVLITGYFSIKSFSWKRTMYLVIEVWFYNLITLLICYNKDFSQITWKDFFPMLNGYYWYALCYILLYIMSPYLNKMIKNISKDEHKKLLAICLVIWCVIPTIWGVTLNDTERTLYYNRFIWMIVLYIGGNYIAKYLEEDKIFSYKAVQYFIGAAAMLVLNILLFIFMETHWEFVTSLGILNMPYFWRPNTIITVIWSFFIFLGFIKLKIPNSRILTVAASTTLGVYLLHDGKIGVFWWNRIFHVNLQADSNILILKIISAAIIIYIAVSLVDLLRQRIGIWCDKGVEKCLVRLKKIDHNNVE